MLYIMQDFTDKQMQTHANVIPSLRYCNTEDFDKHAGLKIHSDMQMSCKTTFFILHILQERSIQMRILC